VRRLIGGDPTAPTEVLARAATSKDPPLLVAAALLSGDRIPLRRARDGARTARDRQLVALADARLRGETEVFDVLVREHLSDYPTSLLAAWIAGEPTPATPVTPPTPHA
jgi:hypothetical protein